jgi:4-hydroxybenzoate polyprenyltransferase
MKQLLAFFRLIRWPNLFFIALTQVLFFFSVVHALHNDPSQISIFNPTLRWHFTILVFSSVFIAAGGYIINDYFDRLIDTVNKPNRVVVDREVKRRWAIVWHWIFSGLGIAGSVYLSWKLRSWVIAPVNTLTVLLLWLYSTSWKKKLLIGNILIALLTAWVVGVVYFFVGASLISFNGWNPDQYPYDIRKLFKFGMLYAGFSFIVSIIREVVKDLEDMQGDAQYQCETMPIVWGVPATKVFAAVWLVVCIGALAVVQIYAWQSGWWLSSLYCIAFIIVPLVLVLRWLYLAAVPADYHRISTWIKWIMLAGILSMLFFRMLPS